MFLAAAGLADGARAADDVITKLGEPRRNVEPRERPVQIVADGIARNNATITGVFPLMIWPSNALFVEAVFGPQRAAVCRSTLADYNRRLVAQHGSSKIRHGLYCVSIANGKVTSIDTVAKSF